MAVRAVRAEFHVRHPLSRRLASLAVRASRFFWWITVGGRR
jgi:hypothetical protein